MRLRLPIVLSPMKPSEEELDDDKKLAIFDNNLIIIKIDESTNLEANK